MDVVNFSIKLEELIQDYFIDILKKQIPIINDLIMTDYNLMLNGVDTNRDSKAKPEYYEDDFRELLNDLDDDFYIKTTGTVGYIVFVVPDETNLDLNDLPLLQLIFEGLPGKYVTATGKQFKNAAEKIGYRKPFNPKARKDDMAYLISYSSALRKRMESILNLRRGLPPYIFSNVRGIDIFETADDYVDKNISAWMDEAGDMAVGKLEGVYK